jgi:hypothetical protein
MSKTKNASQKCKHCQKQHSFSLDNNNDRETQKELHLYIKSNILGNMVFYLYSNVMENAVFKPCQGYKYFTL